MVGPRPCGVMLTLLRPIFLDYDGLGPMRDLSENAAPENPVEAARRGAQIVCLPELFRSLYFCQTEDHSFFKLAEPIPGPTSEALAALARKLNITIIGSIFEKMPPLKPCEASAMRFRRIGACMASCPNRSKACGRA